MHRKSNPVDVNPDQLVDVNDIWTRYPYIRTARDVFLAILLNKPPIITFLGGNEWISAPELEYLARHFYPAFCAETYDGLKRDGIVAWYVEPLKDTNLKVPVTPPRGSGRLRTVLGTRRRQQYEWIWTDRNKADGKMRFEEIGSGPGLDGNLCSPVASLIDEWKTYKILRQSLELVSYRQAHQQHIIEHHPPRNQLGDDNVTSLEMFGDKIAGATMRSTERLRDDKFRVRTDALYEAIVNTTQANRGQKARFGIGPFVRSEGQEQQWEREHAGMVSQSFIMRPDYNYKPVPAPQLHVPYEFVTKRLDALASVVMDVPIQMIESSSKTATNKEGVTRYLNESVKYWLTFFENLIKRVVLESFGDSIESQMQRMGIVDIALDQSIEVRIPVTPIAKLEELSAIYEAQLINQKTYGQHVLNSMGLPEKDLDLSAPQPPAKKAKKDDN